MCWVRWSLAYKYCTVLHVHHLSYYYTPIKNLSSVFREYSVIRVIVLCPNISATRINMSDHEFDLELDGDTDSLYREGGEPEEEVRPVPSLPSLPSLPLEGGDDGPLFPDILLEESEDEPLSDPS